MNEPHKLRLEAVNWFPESLAAGEPLRVQLRAECALGCDLRGAEVTVLDPHGPVLTAGLGSTEGTIFETNEFVIVAPSEVGAHNWSVRVRTAVEQDPVHAGDLPLPPFRTEAHKTSLAVWDVPSPVVIGERYICRVGAKCASGCDLAGREVEVQDESGVRLAAVLLGAAALPGSSGLFWSEVELPAPVAEGVFAHTVGLIANSLPLPHEPSSFGFSFATVKPSRRRLMVKVVEEGSGTPVPDAQVSLGPYRGSTDASGQAVVAVADGPYDLLIWKVGFEAPPRALQVEEDLTIRVEAEVLPDLSGELDD